MAYTAQFIQKMYEKLIKIIEQYIKDEHNKDIILNKLLPDFEQNILTSPASTKSFFNDAQIGGWLNHTLNVVKASLQLMQLWQKNNVNIDFTVEQLMMAALFHDFGKLGTKDHLLYIEETSKWHLDRGNMYTLNPKVPYMKAHDRTLFILQQYGIKLTFNSNLAIKLSSGMFEQSNKSYFMQYDQVNVLTTMLPHIIHQADMISVNIKE